MQSSPFSPSFFLRFVTFFFSFFFFFCCRVSGDIKHHAGYSRGGKKEIETERRKSSRIEIGRGLKQRFRCVVEKGREEGAHIHVRFFFFFFFFVALSKERARQGTRNSSCNSFSFLAVLSRQSKTVILTYCTIIGSVEIEENI